jgi:phosphatidylglycerophosphate synthase
MNWFRVNTHKFSTECINLGAPFAIIEALSRGLLKGNVMQDNMNYQSKDRRPIPARKNPLSQRAAGFLARAGVSANAISILSLVFGLTAGASLAWTATDPAARIWWALAAILILLRLLANMLDGMVAMETGKTSAVGELFNEIPDRVSDVAIFIGAGFAAHSSIHAGYAAAVLSLFVAYVRALGNQMGVVGLFIGPMSKHHRMFTLIAICLFYALAPSNWQSLPLLTWGLWTINIGAVVTILLRIRHIVRRMSS